MILIDLDKQLLSDHLKPYIKFLKHSQKYLSTYSSKFLKNKLTTNQL